MRRSGGAVRGCTTYLNARSGLAVCLAVASSIMTASVSRADDTTDKQAIVERLNGFSDAFNARDVPKLCDLFAPDLIATIPLSAETSRDKLCGNLGRLLAMQDLQLRYDHPDIREVIVNGDIAVVRLVWTLTARKGDVEDSTPEGGLDVFRRQPDGRWSIVRMAAFPFRPNKILDE
jgi:steroid delta-isomerase